MPYTFLSFALPSYSTVLRKIVIKHILELGLPEGLERYYTNLMGMPPPVAEPAVAEPAVAEPAVAQPPAARRRRRNHNNSTMRDVLVDGEEVLHEYKQNVRIGHYDRATNKIRKDGATFSPSGFCAKHAKDTFGVTCEFSGWDRCKVKRNGVWISISSMRQRCLPPA